MAAIYAGLEVVRFPKFLASIGDMNSTCEDLLRFYAAVVEGRLFQDSGIWLGEPATPPRIGRRGDGRRGTKSLRRMPSMPRPVSGSCAIAIAQNGFRQALTAP